jgi:hypothetical protein
MESHFQTSFIPKKPVMATSPSRSKAPINLFSLIATIFFIAALALSGGVFFYKGLIIKQIEENKAALEAAKTAYDPEAIQELIRLDSRLEAGKNLLNSHVAVTPLFNFLSSVTLKSIRFKDFTFTYLASDKIQVAMKGQAQNYTSIALQSDLFNEQKNLKNTSFGDLALDPSGSITFSVSTTIDPGLTSYASTIQPINSTEETQLDAEIGQPVESTETNE